MAAKLQIPTSKLQRSSKSQVPMGVTVTYSTPSIGGFVLNEGDISKHPFDLEERTARFGEAIVRFCKKIPHSPENNHLINQLVGCRTTVGANYCEANEGVSKKDFKNTDRSLCERSERDKVLPSNDCRLGTEPRRRGKDSVSRSKGTAFNFRKYLS